MECILIRHRLFVRINRSAELSVWRIKRSLLYVKTKESSAPWVRQLWYLRI